MSKNFKIGLLDLDSMLHHVSYKQYKAGNIMDSSKTRTHVETYINTIKQNSQCESILCINQSFKHKNFRNIILPEYKGHRTPQDHILIWKEKILQIFEDLGSFPLAVLETDDMQSILSHIIGHDKVVIISADKDMCQVPGTHYNPFKANSEYKDRWQTISKAQAIKNLYAQALSGDSTDMPNEFCGIQGVGFKTGLKLIGNKTDFADILKQNYISKYAEEKGFIRAIRTYRLVRLLTGNESKDSYISLTAQEEVKKILDTYEKYIFPITNDLDNIFGLAPEQSNLYEP